MTALSNEEAMLVNEMIRRGARYFADDVAVLFG
jgi:hypothetical protein